MQPPNDNQQHASDDDVDRQNRFLSTQGAETPNSLSLRERAASQPPRSQSFVAPPPQPVRNNSGGSGSGAWGRFSSGLNPLAHPFSSAMRDSRFASTFEDDESEALSDIQDPYDLYDERFPRNSMSLRGRTYAADLTRSRSQSLATSRPGAIGSGFPGQPFGQWDGSSPQSIPSRYDFKTPTSGSRYGSLGALGRSPSNGYSQGGITDPSNMSPFVRDVGFNAPAADLQEDTSFAQSSTFGGGGGLRITDDELASDLGLLSMNEPRPVTSVQPPSQPSSLPIYAPLSRSPPAASDRVSPYQALHLNIPGGAGNSYSRQAIVGSPSDSGLSGGSPSRGHIDTFVQEGALARETGRPIATQLMARYVPGHGIQQIPEQGVLPTSISPTSLRSPGHFGQPQQMQRRPSDATKPINELGKGMPLHAVPTSWPLYIVEFKAGRTDLFYCTDLSQDIRVVNDTITLAEVEAFQKQQKLMSMGHADVHGVPTSPTGATGGAVKDINPKMIYGKAQHRDTQGLAAKAQDEAKALDLCRNKVRQRKLPMEVVDAEYQWAAVN
uniref:CULLIN_2 domain-containing protein n=1 Tax=Ganoderma boninense TaxID=34458 RepID=A0A5K1K648_9APHY|nr:CULLIN_2 domain-containing protein [Ganoderma boninense]